MTHLKICDLDRQFLSFPYLLCFAQNNTKKTCHATDETLIFMTIQKLIVHLVINTHYYLLKIIQEF